MLYRPPRPERRWYDSRRYVMHWREMLALAIVFADMLLLAYVFLYLAFFQ